MSEDTILGIDLGTTNSAMAVMEAGDPEIKINERGDRTTPSVVSLDDDGTMHVGKQAKNRAVKAPNQTVESIKRRMGEDVEIDLGGESYRPEQISALILQKLKHDAEDRLGQDVNKAVITVPAYFDNQQREATKTAGEIADLEVERIINEPTAAALAYGYGDIDETQTVLVFDLGGGTFDVSMLEIGGGVNKVLATDGNNELGGDDWDEVLVDMLAEHVVEEHGIDPRDDLEALQRLRNEAEEVKKDLSTAFESKIDIPFLVTTEEGPVHLDMRITREQFKALSEHLVEKTVAPTENVIRDADRSIDDIDDVLLVGGSTRMPMIQEQVKEITGMEPQKDINPDEAVALGAAVQGGILAGEIDDLVLLDVTPLSLGVEVKGGLFEPIIERNTTIPTVESSPFTTATDEQTKVQIRVFQGEREIAEENEELGEFTLTGIPPAPAGAPNIDVQFRIDEDGIVHVSAKDEQSGTKDQITLEGTTGLSESKIEKMRQEAEQHAEEDQRRRARIRARNDLHAAQRRAKKLLDKYDEVPTGLQNKINSTLGEIDRTLDDENAIISDFVELNNQLEDLLEQLTDRSSSPVDPDEMNTLSDASSESAYAGQMSSNGTSEPHTSPTSDSEPDTEADTDESDDSPVAEAVPPSEAEATAMPAEAAKNDPLAEGDSDAQHAGGQSPESRDQSTDDSAPQGSAGETTPTDDQHIGDAEGSEGGKPDITDSSTDVHEPPAADEPTPESEGQQTDQTTGDDDDDPETLADQLFYNDE